MSKAFEIYARPVDMLTEALFGGTRHDLFWALKDVSFQVFEKQRIGVIGANGAGKSTLLQIVTGNLKPTTGDVQVNGNVSALLSLVPAWNAEQTGLENIRFNLLLRGCSPALIPGLTEEIVDFTELGPFTYRPVKTYSSGMSARLSFAIATSLEPDILIIDEVLATGDAYFVGKAYKRMTDFCARGRALLFVSHAADAIRQMCDTVIWLQNGMVRKIGPAEYVLKQYEEDWKQKEDETLRKGNVQRSEGRREGVVPGDLVEPGLVRFRLVPEGMGQFTDTHYVRRVCVDKLVDVPIDVPLEIVDLTKPEVVASLDILASEWGRISGLRGREARMLSRFTGRSAGGHIVVKQPDYTDRNELPVRISFETMSILNAEKLAVQFLNMKSGKWEPLAIQSRTDLGENWQRVVAEGEVPSMPDPEEFERTKKAVILASLPPVEMGDVWMEVEGERTSVVRERCAFSIKVAIKANQVVETMDVGIKFMRTDGVYVFWQPSGMGGGNLHKVLGEYVVEFHFDENNFCASEYLVSTYVTNGWDYENNYPCSEVFCRNVNAMKFVVTCELPGVDFGQVNSRARVEYKRC